MMSAIPFVQHLRFLSDRLLNFILVNAPLMFEFDKDGSGRATGSTCFVGINGRFRLNEPK